MTDKQITRINELCATEIMGWKLAKSELEDEWDEWFDEQTQTYPYPVENNWIQNGWSPYSNIAQAMELADEIGWDYQVGGDRTGYYARVFEPMDNNNVTDVSTASAALALACLKAAGIDISEFA